MKQLLGFASILTMALAMGGEPRVAISEPVPLEAPADVAKKWLSFDELTPAFTSPSSMIAFDVAPPSNARARVDVLVRRSGRWEVMSSSSFPPSGSGQVGVPRNERVAILLRFERRPNVYAWAEMERAGDRIVLTLFRTLRLEPPLGRVADAMLFAKDPIPLRYAEGSLRAVPFVSGVLCVAAERASCTLISASTEVAMLDVGGDSRVFRLEDSSPQFQILTTGRFQLRPRTITATAIAYQNWTALSLPAGVSWETVVVDVSTTGAKQRIRGSELLPLPSWHDVRVTQERGVVVRALVGPEKLPHGPGDAKLYLFLADAAEPLSIPFATAKLDEQGMFRVPEIGAGTYALKLFSPEATSEPVVANLSVGVPTDVVFALGPVVRGRVVRQVGGSPDDPVVIELVRQTPVTDTSAVGDWLRTANADADGSFRVTLTATGPYRLRARWGAARGETDFEVNDARKDVDLGDINLEPGVVLRGTLPACANGEITMAPLPDLSQPMTVPFFDYRRVPVAGDGAFVAEGLTPGRWALGATCSGGAVNIAPSEITVPKSGIIFIDLRRVATVE